MHTTAASHAIKSRTVATAQTALIPLLGKILGFLKIEEIALASTVNRAFASCKDLEELWEAMLKRLPLDPSLSRLHHVKALPLQRVAYTLCIVATRDSILAEAETRGKQMRKIDEECQAILQTHKKQCDKILRSPEKSQKFLLELLRGP